MWEKRKLAWTLFLYLFSYSFPFSWSVDLMEEERRRRKDILAQRPSTLTLLSLAAHGQGKEKRLNNVLSDIIYIIRETGPINFWILLVL